jgi:hypothetical protein
VPREWISAFGLDPAVHASVDELEDVLARLAAPAGATQCCGLCRRYASPAEFVMTGRGTGRSSPNCANCRSVSRGTTNGTHDCVRCGGQRKQAGYGAGKYAALCAACKRSYLGDHVHSMFRANANRARRESERPCPDCGTPYSDKGLKRRSARCRPCQSRRHHERSYYWKSAYGMTYDQLVALLAEQGGNCAVCDEGIARIGSGHGAGRGGNAADGSVGVVDHCHTTGRVRGILHAKCNMMLGLADDDARRAARAAQYLDKHRT